MDSIISQPSVKFYKFTNFSLSSFHLTLSFRSSSPLFLFFSFDMQIIWGVCNQLSILQYISVYFRSWLGHSFPGVMSSIYYIFIILLFSVFVWRSICLQCQMWCGKRESLCFRYGKSPLLITWIIVLSYLSRFKLLFPIVFEIINVGWNLILEGSNPDGASHLVGRTNPMVSLTYFHLILLVYQYSISIGWSICTNCFCPSCTWTSRQRRENLIVSSVLPKPWEESRYDFSDKGRYKAEEGLTPVTGRWG